VLRLAISQKRQKELPFDPHHLGGPSSAAKKISVSVVHSAQTVHLSDAEINTVSMYTEASLHLTHVTLEFLGCAQNDFQAYWMFDANRATILRRG
jgi:hypothetical protein